MQSNWHWTVLNLTRSHIVRSHIDSVNEWMMIYHQILLQLKKKKKKPLWHTFPNRKYSAYHCMNKSCCSRPLWRLYHHEVLPLCQSLWKMTFQWPSDSISLSYQKWCILLYATPHITTRTRAFIGTAWDKTHKRTRTHTNPQHDKRWITHLLSIIRHRRS